jgi:hypothetical protein
MGWKSVDWIAGNAWFEGVPKPGLCTRIYTGSIKLITVILSVVSDKKINSSKLIDFLDFALVGLTPCLRSAGGLPLSRGERLKNQENQ